MKWKKRCASAFLAAEKQIPARGGWRDKNKTKVFGGRKIPSSTAYRRRQLSQHIELHTMKFEIFSPFTGSKDNKQKIFNKNGYTLY